MCFLDFDIKPSFHAPNQFKMVRSSLFRVCSGPTDFFRTCLWIQGFKWVGQMCFPNIHIKSSFQARNWFNMVCSRLFRVRSAPPAQPMISESALQIKLHTEYTLRSVYLCEFAFVSACSSEYTCVSVYSSENAFVSVFSSEYTVLTRVLSMRWKLCTQMSTRILIGTRVLIGTRSWACTQ